MSTVITLPAQPLTEAAWAPFGWLPRSDADPRDGDDTLAFAWADAHLNVISHTTEEVRQRDGGLVCHEVFRHLTHTQALLVLDAECVVAVAPPGAVFDGPESLDQVVAFHLRPLDHFVLHAGTWHWGPFPVGAEAVRLHNLQGRRYAEDNGRQPLDAFGSTLVVTPLGA